MSEENRQRGMMDRQRGMMGVVGKIGGDCRPHKRSLPLPHLYYYFSSHERNKILELKLVPDHREGSHSTNIEQLFLVKIKSRKKCSNES